MNQNVLLREEITNMKKILEAPFLSEFVDTIHHLYLHGWDERNAGNLSYILPKEEVKEYLDINRKLRSFPLSIDATPIAGKIFLVTASGKYFKNIINKVSTDCGIIRIDEDGKNASLLWGFEDGGRPTSEFSSHLLSHIERLKVDPDHRIILHTHATNLIAMTFVHSQDEKEFTKTLWKMNTECIIVFPEGVAVLPWMVCGNVDIGQKTAEKFKEYRIVVWSMHGTVVSGKTLDEAFGLIETVEKAAEIYMKIRNLPLLQTIEDKNLRELSKAFQVTPNEKFMH